MAIGNRACGDDDGSLSDEFLVVGDFGEGLSRFGVAHDEETPFLAVGCGRGKTRGLYDAPEFVFFDGLVLVCANAVSAAYCFEEIHIAPLSHGKYSGRCA